MPNIQSKKKNTRKISKQREYNRTIKSRVLTAKKQLLTLLEEAVGKNGEKLKKKMSEYQKILDKAVGRGVMHTNTAGRNKSRIGGLVAKRFSEAKKSE